MKRTMEAWFGELRGMLARGEATPAGELVALLRGAHREDPERYADEWLPYLSRVELPHMTCHALDEIEERAALMPTGAARLTLRVLVPSGPVGARECAKIAADARLGDVTGLKLVFDEHDDPKAPIEALFGSPHLSRLEGLLVEPRGPVYARLPMTVANTVLAGLARAGPRLVRLSIRTFESGVTGWRAFLGSPASHCLKELVLRGPFHSEARLEPPLALLADSEHVRLRRLVLRGMQPTARMMEGIFGSPVFSGLESFDLDGSTIGTMNIAPFVRADVAMRPRRVRMGAVYEPALMSKLLGAAWLAGVESLSFSEMFQAHVDARALAVLLEMPHMKGVRDFDLGAICELTRDELELVARWPGLAGVRTLRLGGQTLDPDGLRVLLRSPYLVRLDLLDLEYAEISAHAARALVDEVDPDKIGAIAFGHVAWAKKKGRGIVLRSDLPELLDVTGLR